MARIQDIHTFGGRAPVLGKIRSFLLKDGALTIEGVGFEEVARLLAALDSGESMTSLLSDLKPGHVRVEKPDPRLSAPDAPAAAPATPKPAAAPAPKEEELEKEDAAPAARRGRGRPPKGQPPAEQPKTQPAAAPADGPSKLNGVLSRAEGALSAINGTAVATAAPTAPKEEAPETFDRAAEPASAAPASPPAANEADAEGELLDGEEDEGDDDEFEEDEDDQPAPQPEPAPAPKPAEKPAPAPAQTAAEHPRVAAAEKRAEQKEKAGPRTLVDDANEEVVPRAAAPKAAEKPAEKPKSKPAEEPAAAAPKGKQQKWLLDPNNLPKELYSAQTMRAFISYFYKNGITDLDAIYAECERIKDQIPRFRSTPDLRSRIEASIEMFPPQPAA